MSAGADTERRLRAEMEREKELARGAEGSAATLSKQLEEARKEGSEKAAEVADLRTRLEEVKVRKPAADAIQTRAGQASRFSRRAMVRSIDRRFCAIASLWGPDLAAREGGYRCLNVRMPRNLKFVASS